jgi:hypothetical protein
MAECHDSIRMMTQKNNTFTFFGPNYLPYNLLNSGCWTLTHPVYRNIRGKINSYRQEWTECLDKMSYSNTLIMKYDKKH